jgi:PAS domain S-box-containing protein
MPKKRPAKAPARPARSRKRVAAPRAEGDYFAQSFQLSPVVMLLARLPGAELIEINDAFTRITGFSREEALGRSTLDLGLWTNRAQRDQFLELMSATGKVREFEAEFITRAGERRWMSLTADVVLIDGQRCMLTVGIDITDRRRRELFQETTYRISEAASAPGDLQALFAKLHELIAGLMPARNLYFALLSPDGSEISFPYFEDEQTPRPNPRPRGRSLTDFVLNTGESLLARHDELHKKLHEKGYAAVGMPSMVWLGAPLVSGGRAIGVVALQDYRDDRLYDEEARRLLTFVAAQVAAAVERRRAEDALRRSEAERRASQEYFVRSFQASPAMMAIARLADGKLLEANAAFFNNSGYSRAEAIGHTTTELGIWPRPEDRAALLQRIMAEGSVRNYEAVFLNRQGQQRFVIVSADIVEFSGERCYIVTAVDITERHHRERVQDATYRISRVVLAGGELRELFAELHEIVAGLMPARNFYVGVLDPTGKTLTFPYFVDETAPAGGFTPLPRPLGQGFTDYVIETLQPQLLTAGEILALLRSRGPYEPPTPLPAVRLGAPLVVDGRAIGAIAIHDYKNQRAYGSEEKRLLTFVAEQAAAAIERRRAELRYRSIFENALEGLYTSTPEGRFINVNPAFARMLGYAAPADLVSSVANIGRQFYVDPGRRDEFFRLLGRAGSDAVTDFESEVYARDGRRIWISESVRAVRDETGRLDHLEGVAVDITVQRETAQALQTAKEAADAASRAKSQFLASMSHELRTPLNGILGYTQILQRDPALDARQRGGVEIINQSAEHLLALINDVLDLARIEAHRLELYPVDFDLPNFARAAAEFFALRAREKSLHLELAIAPDLPRVVRGDVQRLRQVCYNLLGNAVKFTQRGSVIFSVERAGDHIRFSVSDTGPGISDGDVSRLFEPFAQIGDASRHAEGTGLGLNVSRGIVEQMGGRLLLDSKPGWGSRFFFDVPLPPSEPGSLPAAPVTASRVTGYTGVRRRVLVADDHAANRQLLRDLLEPLGFEVREAQDGAAAVELATSWRPDFVALDLKMPKLDGWAAARAIRAALPRGTIHIVAMSASAFESDRQAALDAGCEEFLAKPLREGELLATMARLLDLAWEYADTAAPGTVSPFPTVEQQPEIADADAIHELASKGDVVGVRAYAQRLAERDPRLAPFAQTVISLAQRFKMKAIRQFVARYRAGGSARPFPPDFPDHA